MTISNDNSEHTSPRRTSPRKQGYDYSRPGGYCVTIVTNGNKNLFGDIVDGKMIVNLLGEIVIQQWLELPVHYPNIRLDDFVLMPNHLHGILWIDEPEQPEDSPGVTLSDVLRGFKTWSARSVNEARKMTGVPVWQRSFKDQIIPNDRYLNALRDYIRKNPLNWELDSERI